MLPWQFKRVSYNLLPTQTSLLLLPMAGLCRLLELCLHMPMNTHALAGKKHDPKLFNPVTRSIIIVIQCLTFSREIFQNQSFGFLAFILSLAKLDNSASKYDINHLYDQKCLSKSSFLKNDCIVIFNQTLHKIHFDKKCKLLFATPSDFKNFET